MKKLRINVFDPESIQRACDEIEKLEKRVDKKTVNAVKNIANTLQEKIGENYAAVAVSGVEGFQPNDSEHKLSQGEIEDKHRFVTIEGKSVLFVEFGTGITKSDSPEARSILIAGDVVGHGEYGLGNGANPNGWYLNGEKTMGMDAQTPVYRARKEVSDEIPKVLKDTFKDL